MAAAAERKSWTEPNRIIGERERERGRERVKGYHPRTPQRPLTDHGTVRERERREKKVEYSEADAMQNPPQIYISI